jgi:hypothetical protein
VWTSRHGVWSKRGGSHFHFETSTVPTKWRFGVIIVCDHDVLVAAARCDGKTSCLITVDLAGNFDSLHVYTAGAFLGLIECVLGSWC